MVICEHVHKFGVNVFHGSLALNLMLLVTLYVVGTKKTELLTDLPGKSQTSKDDLFLTMLNKIHRSTNHSLEKA